MDNENQITVPPSFLAVYSDARGRLRDGIDTVRARYELCEDLSSALVEQAQTLYHLQTPSESEVLLRVHAGLGSAESGLQPGEATWATVRLAELLGWPCPQLPAESAEADAGD